MALYSYVNHRKKSPRKKVPKFISGFFIFSGLGLLLFVTYPIISFELFYAPKFEGLLRPISNEIVTKTLAKNVSYVLGAENVDYTKASAWFPKAVTVKYNTNTLVYSLNIPKLHITEATVTVGGEDLSKSLIHFTGPLPGNVGNPVIFGHSTIIWFYNPKDYTTIFSKLPELRIGDDIIINIDNITYKYQVFEMTVVSPDNLSVLEQNYDGATLSLITCVPPGTYFKRLVVKSRLTNI